MSQHCFAHGALAVLALLGCQSRSPEPSELSPTPTPQPAAMPQASQPAAAAATPQGVATPPAEPQLPAPPDVAAPPADAEKTASGLVTRVLQKGTGTARPKPADRVTVHYTGWTRDSHMFDSSVLRGAPASFAVQGVIPGWTEALQLMTQGEKRRLWIPAALAYGDVPQRPGAPAGPLVFDVELLGIQEAPKPPPVPADVAKAPASAKKTKSGLAYRVLKPGKKDGRRPGPADMVTVQYSGWTTDGKLFDSSRMRGQPARFRVNQVIPGWTEGLQLMKEGEEIRLWIPGKLAYGDKPQQPGAPAGTLVFDVELLGSSEN